MAQICAKCGKKVGVLSSDPLQLDDNKILCYSCAEPIRDKINALYYAKSEKEFDSLKAQVIQQCTSSYSGYVVKAIERKIDSIDKPRNDDTTKHVHEKKELTETHMLTTGFDFNGYRIVKYKGVISGQVVLGTGFLSEFTASFADFFGEESNEFANKLEKAKNAATNKMIIKSIDKGGNAIIGVDFDYITLRGNMIGVVANGTSVIVEEIENYDSVDVTV